MLYKNTLDTGTLELLNALMELKELQSFNLVGGTALALQIGHRKSIDVDLFTFSDFDSEAAFELLRESFSDIIVIGQGISKNLVNVLINGIKVDLLAHKYPLIGTLNIMHPKEDIAAMKLNVISRRGAKKDFWDYSALLNYFSLAEMLAFYKEKYRQFDISIVLRSLGYFEEAEKSEEQILSLGAETWANVKQRTVNSIQDYYNSN